MLRLSLALHHSALMAMDDPHKKEGLPQTLPLASIMPVKTETSTLPSGVTLGYRQARKLNHDLPTIVLFHSFLMDSALYNPQFDDVAYKNYNLIAIDEHGHGKTSGRSSFTFWDTASDSLEFLTTLGIDKFFVLGTSQGGFIAMRMALLAPERVRGLVLLGTNAEAESEKNKTLFVKSRERWCSTNVPTERELEIKASSFGGKDAVPRDVYDAICENWRTRHAGIEGYGPASQCLCDRDSLMNRLGEIACPVLIMHGTKDTVYTVASAEAWAPRLKNLYRFVTVEGGWHYLSFSGPGVEACRREIPAFITHATHASKL